MYSLLKLPYLLASWVATATSAPALGPLAFGSSVPLELGDGRCGSLGSPPSEPLPFSLDRTRLHVLDCQRGCHRHLCVCRLHCPAVHFSPRATTYPQYVASLFASNEFIRTAVAAVAILFARLLYLNLENEHESSILTGFKEACVGGICVLYFCSAMLRSRSRFAMK